MTSLNEDSSVRQAKLALRSISLVLAFLSMLLIIGGKLTTALVVFVTAATISLPTFFVKSDEKRGIVKPDGN